MEFFLALILTIVLLIILFFIFVASMGVVLYIASIILEHTIETCESVHDKINEHIRYLKGRFKR